MISLQPQATVAIAITLFALCPALQTAWGQKDAGRITGSVRDPASAVVASTKVVGQVSETVNVKRSAPLLESETSELGHSNPGHVAIWI